MHFACSVQILYRVLRVHSVPMERTFLGTERASRVKSAPRGSTAAAVAEAQVAAAPRVPLGPSRPAPARGAAAHAADVLQDSTAAAVAEAQVAAAPRVPLDRRVALHQQTQSTLSHSQ